MANPQIMLRMSADFLKRNNPIEASIRSFVAGFNNLLTFNSRMKVLKYKFILMQQQMNRMEENLHQGSPYSIRGQKLNKTY